MKDHQASGIDSERRRAVGLCVVSGHQAFGLSFGQGASDDMGAVVGIGLANEIVVGTVAARLVCCCPIGVIARVRSFRWGPFWLGLGVLGDAEKHQRLLIRVREVNPAGRHMQLKPPNPSDMQEKGMGMNIGVEDDRLCSHLAIVSTMFVLVSPIIARHRGRRKP